MHEISLCESIRDILEEEAIKGGFAKVSRIWLEVGALSCVEPEALRFGFDVVMKGSVAEGAALDISVPPTQAQCLACHETVSVARQHAPCPKCGETALQVTRGDELKIKKLEVV